MGKGSRLRQQRERAKAAVPREQVRAIKDLIADEVDKAIKAANATLVQTDNRYWRDINVMILATLHVECGFSKKRLHAFTVAFDRFHRQLRERYETEDETTAWECEMILKEIGVDIDAWMAEASDD